MIVSGSGLKVVVATRPVDFRKGHDGLVAMVEHELGPDPYSGVVVVFRPGRDDLVVDPLPVPGFARQELVCCLTNNM